MQQPKRTKYRKQFKGTNTGLALWDAQLQRFKLVQARVGWGASGRNGGQMIAVRRKATPADSRLDDMQARTRELARSVEELQALSRP